MDNKQEITMFDKGKILQEDTVVHCETEEQYNNIIRFSNKLGYINDAEKSFMYHEDKSCVELISKNKKLCVSYVGFYDGHNYTILAYEDVLLKECSTCKREGWFECSTAHNCKKYNKWQPKDTSSKVKLDTSISDSHTLKVGDSGQKLEYVQNETEYVVEDQEFTFEQICEILGAEESNGDFIYYNHNRKMVDMRDKKYEASFWSNIFNKYEAWRSKGKVELKEKIKNSLDMMDKSNEALEELKKTYQKLFKSSSNEINQLKIANNTFSDENSTNEVIIRELRAKNDELVSKADELEKEKEEAEISDSVIIRLNRSIYLLKKMVNSVLDEV